MKTLKTNFSTILSIYIVLAVSSALVLVLWMHNYDKKVKHVYDKESRLLKWKLESVEESCVQMLTTVNELFAVKPSDSDLERINFGTRIFSAFINGYEIIDEFKGLSSDGIVLRVVKLDDERYMRRFLFHDEKKVYVEQFTLDKLGMPVNIERLKNSQIQKEDTSWFENDLYYTNKIVFSEFYQSHMLNREIIEAANLSNDNSGRLLAVDVSLDYMAKSFQKIKQLDSHFIVCDKAGHIVLLASGTGDELKLESNIELNVTQPEVRQFLNETLDKKYFPGKFTSFKYSNKPFVARWESIKLGNQTYRLGYMIEHNNSMWQVWLFFVLNAFFVVFLLFIIRSIRNYASERYDSHHTPATARIPSRGMNSPSDGIRAAAVVESDKDEDYKAVYDALIELFKSEKAYLDVNCSLGQLSNTLSCNRTTLSKAVLAENNKTVKEFINDYRIADAVEFMKNDKQALVLSIDAIAEKYGFKSRASFHREFNKRMNFSPVEFININQS
ncbi:MAG: helix-turn-helix transcriptional regulator [Bacteroidales bacterium]|nr:helix-turn-helix transcriptional regulator [Bacteroidales bacterium]